MGAAMEQDRLTESSTS